MSAKTQNPVPPVYPMGATSTMPGEGANTVFPLGQEGITEGVPIPTVALTVLYAGETSVNGDYTDFGYLINGRPAYHLIGNTLVMIYWEPILISWQLWYVPTLKYRAAYDVALPPTSGWVVNGATPSPPPTIVYPPP